MGLFPCEIDAKVATSQYSKTEQSMTIIVVIGCTFNRGTQSPVARCEDERRGCSWQGRLGENVPSQFFNEGLVY
jgi:hypothetical protein